MEPRRRGAWAIVLSLAFVAAAAVVGVFLGLFMGDGSWREWLLSLGGSAELFGLLGVASPELVLARETAAPAVSRTWQRAAALVRRVENRVRRLLGRPQHHTIHTASELNIAMSLRGSARVSVSEGATLDEKVEYLLRRDEVVQERLETLHVSVSELPDRWQADIGAESARLREEHAAALAELRDEHKLARLIGVGLLFVGLVLATLGNLV